VKRRHERGQNSSCYGATRPANIGSHSRWSGSETVTLLYPHTPMSSEVFNPNPTIITTAGPTARKRAAQARHSLWLSDDDDSATTYDSDSEPEPIDADEVFGAILSIRFLYATRPKI
jgi:hypothetical protein